MTKARDLADLISTGNPLADGAIAVSEVTGAAPLASPTFTGDVTLPDKIVHTGDTNTAIRFADADTVTVETGGSERMRIDDSGRVNVAATTGNEKLNVAGALGVSGASANFSGGNERALVDFTGTLARFGHVNGSSGSAKDVSILSGGGEKFRFGSSGQLGIGGATYGTSGQVLTSGGASAAPTWADAGGGSYELILKQTISSAVSGLNFSNPSAPQGQLLLILDRVTVSQNTQIMLTYKDSSGNTLNGTGAYSTAHFNWGVGGHSGNEQHTFTSILLHKGMNMGYLYPFSSRIDIYGWGTTTPTLTGQHVYTDSAGPYLRGGVLAAKYTDGSNVPNRLNISPQSGNLTGGDVYLYKLL